MESFRWVLLGMGILIIVGIYLLFVLERRFPHWFGKAMQHPSEDTAITEEEVIFLNICRRDGDIAGTDLARVMEKYNLVHGDMGIFHRLTEGSHQPLFSVANMVEPGSFDVDQLANLTTPGITLFLQLPRAFDAVHAMDELLAAAQGIAAELDGEVLDRNRQPFSAQKQQTMRDEVLEYTRQIALHEKIGR